MSEPEKKYHKSLKVALIAGIAIGITDIAVRIWLKEKE